VSVQNRPQSFSKAKDQRRFRRRATLFSGTIIDAKRAVDVVVLDVSVNGAKLRVPEAFTCNRYVVLRIERLGQFAARVVWKRDNRLGLQFTEPPEKVAKRLPSSFAARLAPPVGEGADSPRIESGSNPTAVEAADDGGN